VSFADDLSSYLKLDQTTPQTTVGRFTFPSLKVDTNTLYVDNINHRLGIGTTTPKGNLDVTDVGATNQDRGIVISEYSTNAAAAVMNFAKYRGTIASPTVVSTGDYIGGFNSKAWSGSSLITSAGFGFRVNGTVTSTSVPQDIYFFNSGGTQDSNPYTNGTIKLCILANGNVGIGTATPDNTFVVSATQPVLSLKTTGFSHNFYDSTYTRANSSGVFTYFSQTNGGTSFIGIGKSTAPGLSFYGLTNEQTPTIAPIRFVGMKRNATNNTTTIGDTEKVLSIFNAGAGGNFATGTEMITLLGSGYLGIGTTNPGGKLEIVGENFPVYSSVRTTTNTNSFNSGSILVTRSLCKIQELLTTILDY